MNLSETLSADFIDAQYRKWKSDPSSLSDDWQFFFKGFELAGDGRAGGYRPGAGPAPGQGGGTDSPLPGHRPPAGLHGPFVRLPHVPPATWIWMPLAWMCRTWTAHLPHRIDRTDLGTAEGDRGAAEADLLPQHRCGVHASSGSRGAHLAAGRAWSRATGPI
jgi:hypothetical protein